MSPSTERVPAWINHPELWGNFLETVRTRSKQRATRARDLTFERHCAQVREFEFELDDDKLEALDDAGFDWDATFPRRSPRWAGAPIVKVAAKPVTTNDDLVSARDRLWNGSATVEDIQLLQHYNTNPDQDAFDLWIREGITACASAGVTVIAASASTEQPNGFALATWAQELQRAAALGLLDNVRARHPELPYRPTLLHLHGLGSAALWIRENGHTEIPMGATVPRPNGAPFFVGRWVQKQRTRATEGTLEPDLRAALAHLDIRLQLFTPEVYWDRATTALDQYIARRYPRGTKRLAMKTGHVEYVEPTDEREGFSVNLGSWLNTQKVKYRNGELSASQVAALRTRGIDLDAKRDIDELWERGITVLDWYLAKLGHQPGERMPHIPNDLVVRVPDIGRFNLGQWLATKASLRRKGLIPGAHEAALDARGMVWNYVEDEFQRALGFLKDFKAEHGHVEVPQEYVVLDERGDPFDLGTWVANKRRDFKNGNLPAHRHQALAELGFVTNMFDVRWERTLRAFDQWRAEHDGDPCVPPRAVVQFEGHEVKLGAWVRSLRERYKPTSRNPLDPERIAQLDAHGFVWNVTEYRFQQGLAALTRYASEHDGSVDPPQRYRATLPNGQSFALRGWIDSRREMHAGGRLPKEHWKALRDLGVDLTSSRSRGHGTPTRDNPPASIGR